MSLLLLKLAVSGMTCADCADLLRKKVCALAGVTDVRVGLVTRSAEVTFDPVCLNENDILQTLQSLGFPSSVTSRVVDPNPSARQSNTKEMCVFEVSVRVLDEIERVKVQDALRQAGTLVCSTRLEACECRITAEYDPDRVGVRTLMTALQQSVPGVEPSFPPKAFSLANPIVQMYRRLLFLCFVLVVPILAFSFIFPLAGGRVDRPFAHELVKDFPVRTLVAWILSTPIQFYAGWPLYVSGYRALRYGRTANIDVLVMLSTTVAYLYSVVAAFAAFASHSFTDESFFETSAILLSLIILGRYMEVVAKEKTSDALRDLTELQPAQAILLPEGLTNMENENVIDVRLLHHSDILKVVPGARIPTDGVIIMGETTVDESMVTGESLPVIKKAAPPSDNVAYSSTISNPCLPSQADTCTARVSSPPPSTNDKCCDGGQCSSLSKSAEPVTCCDAGQCSSLSKSAEPVTTGGAAPPYKNVKCCDDERCSPVAKTSCLEGTDALSYMGDKVGDGGRCSPRGECVKPVTSSACCDDKTAACALPQPSPDDRKRQSVPSYSQVLGGTINQTGMIYIRVTHTVAENTLSKIAHMVQQAQMTKPPVQRMADRVSAIMVPAIVVLSFAVFFFWFGLAEGGVVDTSVPSVAFALKFALATLVVSCPCAVGLAVPTAIMVGTGVGAKLGVLFADGSVIEHTHRINTVVFDKTGTITQGKPRVTSFKRIVSQAEVSEEEFWFFLGSAEMGSEHALGRAIVDHARSFLSRETTSLQSPSEFQALPGKGLSCSVGKHALLVGHFDFLVENQVEMANEHELLNDIASLEQQGCTVICMAVNGQLVGMVALSDLPKPEAKFVVERLTRIGMEVWMLSGDNEKTALKIAAMVGIESSRVMGRVLPGDKASRVMELQEQGKVVCMVGDGINDSPALTQANVGVAVGAGTDIALAAADIVLVKNDLRDLLVAMELSRVTFGRIKLNFFWAFLYNLIAIPLAVGVFYPLGGIYIPPPIAGLSELFSSLPVVISSLLLKRFTPTRLLEVNFDCV